MARCKLRIQNYFSANILQWYLKILHFSKHWPIGLCAGVFFSLCENDPKRVTHTHTHTAKDGLKNYPSSATSNVMFYIT